MNYRHRLARSLNSLFPSTFARDEGLSEYSSEKLKPWAKTITVSSFIFFLRLSSSVLSSVFVIHKDETHGAFVSLFCTMSRLQLACAQEPSLESVLFSSSSIHRFNARLATEIDCNTVDDWN